MTCPRCSSVNDADRGYCAFCGCALIENDAPLENNVIDVAAEKLRFDMTVERYNAEKADASFAARMENLDVGKELKKYVKKGLKRRG